MSQYLTQRIGPRPFEITGHCTRAVVLFALLTWVVFTGGTRTLRGRVTDERGHALVGAIVQVQSNSTFWDPFLYYANDGLYYFAGLFTDDSFRVQAKYNGIPSETRALSKFSSRTLATVNLVVDLSYSKLEGSTRRMAAWSMKRASALNPAQNANAATGLHQ